MTPPTMTLTEQIDNLKTPAKHLLRGLYDAFSDAIEIPNSLLPEKLHGKTGRSVAELQRSSKPTPAELAKIAAEEREIEKSLRLESYCSDANAQREIRFHEDEERLYRNQITFAKLLELEFDE